MKAESIKKEVYEKYFFTFYFAFCRISMKQPVGILGGTFDPFHHGHLRLAIECREKLQLRSLRLIPLYTPPHRQPPVASAGQRLAMLEIAVRGHKFLQVDDCELRRHGVSYTIDTLKQVRNDINDEPLCLLMGRDAFNTLTSWRDWQHLIDYCHIVVVDRPGKPLSSSNAELAEFIRRHLSEKTDELAKLPAGKLLEIDIPLLDISSTQIRAIIQAGHDPSGLLPEEVIDYIHTHSLYRQDQA